MELSDAIAVSTRSKTPAKPPATPHKPSAPSGPKKHPTMAPDSLVLSAPVAPPPPPPPPPVRTAAEVDAGLRKVLLIPTENPVSQSGEAWRTVDEKAWSIKLYRDKQIWYNGDYTAESELKANDSAEAAVLATLTPEQQGQVSALKAAIADLNTGPRLALQAGLVDGTLLKPDADGKTLLGTLSGIQQQVLHDKIDRGELLAGLLEELVEPVTVAQQNSGTCTVTSLQIKMVEEKPQEYLRLVAGLASPEGKVVLANHEELTRAADTESAAELVRGTTTSLDSRTISSRLWQSAMMEFGDGPDAHYDVKKDIHVGGSRDGGKGMTDTEITRAYNAVTGQDYQAVRVSKDLSAEQLIQKLQEATARGERIPTSLKWKSANDPTTETGYHMVLLRSVDDAGLHFDNPWGEKNSMSRAEALQRVDGAHFPKP